MKICQPLYINPVFGGHYFHALMKFESWRKPPIPPVHVRFTLTNGGNEGRTGLQRREGKWEIADLSARTAAASRLGRNRQIKMS